MSSISSLYSTVATYPSYATGQASSVPAQALKSLAGVGSAIQSGDSQAAQDALAQLQAALGVGAGTSTSSATNASVSTAESADTSAAAPSESDLTGPFTNNTAANADYQSMVLNLGSGDLAAAAKDYAQLQTDLKLHSRHHSSAVPVPTFTSGSDSSTAGNVINVTV